MKAGNVKVEAEFSVTSRNKIRGYVKSTLKQHRKKTWKSHRYFIDFESGIDIVLSTSNRCGFFDVNSTFIIDEPSATFRCGISMSNRWRINEIVTQIYYKVIIMSC